MTQSKSWLEEPKERVGEEELGKPMLYRNLLKELVKAPPVMMVVMLSMMIKSMVKKNIKKKNFC